MSTETATDALELAREARDSLIEAADEAIHLAEAGDFTHALSVAVETAREAKALKNALIRADGLLAPEGER